jgi:serine protease AprX
MNTTPSSAPRRFRAWKRNLCAAVAVATLAPAGLMISHGMAHADPVVASGGQCPADSDALTSAASADIPWLNWLAAVQKRGVDGFSWFDVLNNKGSMYNVARSIGADAFYQKGYYGQGVDVALIDSGVAPVKGLDNGNVVQGPDLSFESQNPDFAHNDTFGHGTNLASIIAGRDNTDPAQGYGANDPTSFTGIAPGARVISLKAGDAAGAVDVSQVIAGVDWVVKHAHDAPTAANPKGFNIRVLNLSLGFNAPLYNTARLDALSYAVDQAWNAGIVVVASAGNDGTAKSRAGTDLAKLGVASPAFNGDVIAVGSYDQTSSSMSTFSQSASQANRRAPDFTAPGAHIQGLRVPGDAADDEVIAACQAGVTTGQWTQPAVGPDGRFQRASGTSQAAAVVSGAVALLLSRPTSDLPAGSYPVSPDSIKGLLKRTAVDNPNVAMTVEGQGMLCLSCAIAKPVLRYVQQVTAPIGGGSLDDARGHQFITDADGVALQGDEDIFGNAVDTVALAKREAIDPKTGKYVNNVSPWVTQPDGSEVWFNGSFSLSGMPAADPTLGTTFGNGDWTARSWTARSWSGRSWSARSWTARSWSGRSWSARSWSSDSLDARSWSARSWSARSWSDFAWQDEDWS